jgi:hypothetical protein
MYKNKRKEEAKILSWNRKAWSTNLIGAWSVWSVLPNLHGTLHASRSRKRWSEQKKEKTTVARVQGSCQLPGKRPLDPVRAVSLPILLRK